MPELLRMKGRVLSSLPQPSSDAAEVHLVQALELSRRRGATAWELRIAIDLAELFAGRRRRKAAKLLLQSALGGFVEGSDTADIRAATELLGML
ncbi:hypothetical protein AYJ54_41535 [Bradyrhizobium centrolobii]|uniref:Uncharacterized protein n=2 Tax=Bradyrhizobium centrolobii TaxID=1505087 RepID=A0A176Z267_9BRAD|nr:hypothetical protein AYJ54_41535 [Bradyrhizobium centrolobii]